VSSIAPRSSMGIGIKPDSNSMSALGGSSVSGASVGHELIVLGVCLSPRDMESNAYQLAILLKRPSPGPFGSSWPWRVRYGSSHIEYIPFIDKSEIKSILGSLL
jgi:hypothetical protein